MANTDVLTPPDDLRTASRQQAIDVLRRLVEDGPAFQSLRIQTPAQLQQARQKKLAWSRDVNTILETFAPNLVEKFNGWHGPLLPENAPVNVYAEALCSDMDYRVQQADAALKFLDSLTEIPVPPRMPRPTPAERAETEKAIKTTPPKPATPTHEDPKVIQAASRTTAQEHTAHPATPARAQAPASPARGLLILHAPHESCESRLADFAHKLGFELTTIHRPVVQSDQTPAEPLPDAKDFAFALVLAVNTPDGGQQNPRSLFELGYCVGRFGTQRVSVLHPDSTGPIFKDDCDLTHLPIDPADGWQLQLARQLKTSGLPLDLNRLC